MSLVYWLSDGVSVDHCMQATDKTGLPFQQTILKKLVMWKMQSMF